ncbi:hypothetical protein RHOFW510R12_00865 [Rhodanobacter sp. FW510-R12]|uniref:hypothetical protein n=1 Tax=Rhodanobacter thiooxydans TaxID=416169 RepID=UPI000917D26E|nr:hypothetical protein [Rhodanobacter thiooxydans]UJJ56793.1 hypothetical protein LRK53_18430 [Rhodanobacter thiooxydans]
MNDASADLRGQPSSDIAPGVARPESNGLCALATSLDALYLAHLDRLQAAAENAIALVGTLSGLGYLPGQTAMLNNALERTASAQDIFRQLAALLMLRARPELDPMGAKASVPVEDLIDWTTQPPRHTLGALDHALQKIRYARGHSLGEFLRRVIVRLTPESVPDDARKQAAEELIVSVGMRMPTAWVLSHGPSDFGTVVYSHLTRQDQEMPWHLTPAQVASIDRALISLATMCAVCGQAPHAVSLQEAGGAVVKRLRYMTKQYGDGDLHAIGTAVRLVLHRDRIAFHLAPEVWAVARRVLQQHVAGIELVASR